MSDEHRGATSRVVRLALAAYPPSFRARYGRELAGLVDDMGVRPRTALDLLLGAARAWVRPVFAGDRLERRRLRLQATVSTTWVAWSVVVVGSLSVLRAVEDPPPPGFDPHHGGWAAVHDSMATALLVGWVLVLAAGVPLGVRALRSGPRVRRAVLPPVALIGVCVVAFLPLQVYASTHWIAEGRSPVASDIPLWWAVWAVAWLFLVAVGVAWTTVALALGLRMSAPSAGRLRLPAVAAAVLLVPMAVLVGGVLAVVVTTGPGAAGWLAPGVCMACLGIVVAMAVAVTSAARALPTLVSR